MHVLSVILQQKQQQSPAESVPVRLLRLPRPVPRGLAGGRIRGDTAHRALRVQSGIRKGRSRVLLPCVTSRAQTAIYACDTSSVQQAQH